MIFTDKFVYIHEPKTGGTFVTAALFRLYGLRWTRLTHLRNSLVGEVRHANAKYGLLVHDSNKHGFCSSIPAAQQQKTVLASVRNPYDLYVSQYEFGWWKRREFLKYFRAVPSFDRAYPRFPEITFAEYVRLVNEAFPVYSNGDRETSAGLHTEQFFKYYFRRAPEAFARMRADDDYVSSGRYRDDMFKLHFIRTDALNRGLYDFLSQMNYDEEDIRFILDLGRILPKGRGRSVEQQKWESYYTPELKRRVREKERFIFELFPEFDV